MNKAYRRKRENLVLLCVCLLRYPMRKSFDVSVAIVHVRVFACLLAALCGYSLRFTRASFRVWLFVARSDANVLD